MTSNEPFLRQDQDLTDPRLCAAIFDRLTFAGQIIETATTSYRLSHARTARRNSERPRPDAGHCTLRHCWAPGRSAPATTVR